MADPSELLERHRPQLRHDSQDPFHAASALTIVEHPGNKLLGKDGSTIAVAAPERPLDLGMLDGDPAREGERLDEVGSELEIKQHAVAMQDDARYADRAYGRAVQRGSKTYLQYWFWFYYNPKDVARRGRHEGDWEMIQLTLEGERPTCAVYAQHDHAVKRSWDEVPRHPKGNGPHPVVYVAAESHASYFDDGTHPAFGRADNAYGDGYEIMPRLEQFGDWAEWRGRWGNSGGIFPWFPWSRGEPPAGRSPKSPGCQNPKWEDPERFEREAKDGRVKENRLLWRIGTRTYPLKPRIRDVQVSGTTVRVSYETPRKLLVPRPRHLLVTVNAPDAKGDVLGRTSEANAPREGTVTVELTEVPERGVVRASVFNRARQRSEVATAELPV